MQSITQRWLYEPKEMIFVVVKVTLKAGESKHVFI